MHSWKGSKNSHTSVLFASALFVSSKKRVDVPFAFALAKSEIILSLSAAVHFLWFECQTLKGIQLIIDCLSSKRKFMSHSEHKLVVLIQ